jgi:two-component system response regulator FixJ
MIGAKEAVGGPAAPVTQGSAYVVAGDTELREALVGALRAAGWEAIAFPTVTHLTARLDGLAPGCIVSGLCVESADGALLLGELAARACRFPVVALAPQGDVAVAVKAMKAGAADVVALPLQPAVLAEAARMAMSSWSMSMSMRGEAVPEAVRLRLARLTRRERQVLESIVRGDGNKAIAHELGISARTVEVHRAKVMEKLSCRSLSDVIRLAMQAGLLRA